jgi:uncharacterized damage-inducible protein DinB
MEIQSAESFLAYFEGVRGRTRRVAERIPADRVEWTFREGAFTLGDLVRHIAATERWMFAENAAGRPSRYPGHGRELADGRDGVLEYLDRMHAESVEIVAGLTADDLARRVETPAGATIAAWKWLRAMVEHEVHHRGQIYLMLNMLGVPTPPIYGLTSEEVRERSLAPDA